MPFTCPRCRDAGWLCEEHPDSPAPHGICNAAQFPCPDCQTDPPQLPAGGRSLIDAPECQRCAGTGFVCDLHRSRPMDHLHSNGIPARAAECAAMSLAAQAPPFAGIRQLEHRPSKSGVAADSTGFKRVTFRSQSGHPVINRRLPVPCNRGPRQLPGPWLFEPRQHGRQGRQPARWPGSMGVTRFAPLRRRGQPTRGQRGDQVPSLLTASPSLPPRRHRAAASSCVRSCMGIVDE